MLCISLLTAKCLVFLWLLQWETPIVNAPVLDKIVDAAPHTPSYVEKTAASFFEAVEAQDTEAVKALFVLSALRRIQLLKQR